MSSILSIESDVVFELLSDEYELVIEGARQWSPGASPEVAILMAIIEWGGAASLEELRDLLTPGFPVSFMGAVIQRNSRYVQRFADEKYTVTQAGLDLLRDHTAKVEWVESLWRARAVVHPLVGAVILKLSPDDGRSRGGDESSSPNVVEMFANATEFASTVDESRVRFRSAPRVKWVRRVASEATMMLHVADGRVDKAEVKVDVDGASSVGRFTPIVSADSLVEANKARFTELFGQLFDPLRFSESEIRNGHHSWRESWGRMAISIGKLPIRVADDQREVFEARKLICDLGPNEFPSRVEFHQRCAKLALQSESGRLLDICRDLAMKSSGIPSFRFHAWWDWDGEPLARESGEQKFLGNVDFSLGAVGPLMSTVLDLIDRAREMIVVGSFLITDGPILEALRQKALSGVRVYVLTSGEEALKVDRVQLDLETMASVRWHGAALRELAKFSMIRSRGSWHAKFLLIDPVKQPAGILMSANLKTTSLSRAPEVGVILSPLEVAEVFALVRREFWERAESEFEALSTGEVRRSSIIKSTMVNVPACSRILVSDALAGRGFPGVLKTVIEAAKDEILLSAFRLSPSDDIASLLVDAARRAVTVKVGLAEPVGRYPDRDRWLVEAGVHVEHVPYLHAKLLSVDGTRTFCSTGNFDGTTHGEKPSEANFDMAVELTGGAALEARGWLRGILGQ